MKKLISVLMMAIIAINAQGQFDPANYYAVGNNQKTPIFTEEFDNNSNEWLEGLRSTMSTAVNRSSYMLQSLSDDNSETSHLPIPFDHSKDFQIETEIKYFSGEASRGHALLWGVNTGNSYSDYGFMFTESGEFEVTKYANGNYEKLIDWTSLTNYKKGEYNLLTVRKVKNKYYFFFNKKLVGTIPYQYFTGNSIGFEIGKTSLIRANFLHVSYIKASKSGGPRKPNSPQSPSNNSSIDASVYGNIAVNKKKVIMKEDFINNAYDWGVGKSDATNRKIDNGYFYFKTYEESFYSTMIEQDLRSYRNFEIETKIKCVEGGIGYENCILWGMDDNKHSFRFGITPKGQYTAYKMSPNGIVDYVDYTDSPEVSNIAYTKLTIRKYNNMYYFFLNEKLVHSAPFEPLYGGNIGYLIGKGQAMKIDYLYVYEIK